MPVTRTANLDKVKHFRTNETIPLKLDWAEQTKRRSKAFGLSSLGKVNESIAQTRNFHQMETFHS